MYGRFGRSLMEMIPSDWLSEREPWMIVSFVPAEEKSLFSSQFSFPSNTCLTWRDPRRHEENMPAPHREAPQPFRFWAPSWCLISWATSDGAQMLFSELAVEELLK